MAAGVGAFRAEPIIDRLSALRTPLARYLVARVFASLAIQMQVVAVGWQIYSLTGSALALGLVGLVQFVPSVLLVLVTGPIIDRVARQRVLAVARTAEALAAGVLAWAAWHDQTSRGLIYGAVAVIGAARAFELPSMQALVPRLVTPAELPRAIALSTSSGQAATIAGPALGGLLYVFGPAAVYGTASVLFLIGAAAVLGLPGRSDAPAARRVDLPYLLGGFAYIRAQPILLGAVSLDMVAVLLGGATALLPIFARDILHAGPEQLGLLRAAPAIGALAVALWLVRHPLRTRVGRKLFAGVAVFGLATLVFALSRVLWLSVLALAVTGAADMISVVVRQSLVQIETPDALRGRVSSVNSVFIGASNQLGEFESGLLAAWLGPVGSAVFGGIGTLLVVALWQRLFPALRERDRIASPDEGEARGA